MGYEFENLECSDCNFNWKLELMNKFDPLTVQLPVNKSLLFRSSLTSSSYSPHGRDPSTRRNSTRGSILQSCAMPVGHCEHA